MSNSINDKFLKLIKKDVKNKYLKDLISIMQEQGNRMRVTFDDRKYINPNEPQKPTNRIPRPVTYLPSSNQHSPNEEVRIKKTFSEFFPKANNNTSQINPMNNTKLPRVIFDLIGEQTRQQRMSLNNKSQDDQRKSLKSKRKSFFMNKSDRSKSQHIQFFDDDNLVQQNIQPTGNVRRSIVGLTNIPSMASSRGRKMTCPICLEEGAEKDFMTISDKQCDHFFCRSCIHQYVIYKIKIFEKVTCPHDKCPIVLKKTSGLYAQLPLDTREKFKKIVQYAQVMQMKDKRICPNQDCTGILDISQPQRNPRCQQCKIVYCRKCFFKSHAGECDPFQIKFFQQTLNYRQCAKCFNMIQKNQGCNHMTCRCGYQFCYLCGAKWRSSHICEGMGIDQPYVRQTCQFCCCECEQCDICDSCDYFCQCICFDQWEICEIKPVRWLGKFLVIVLVLTIGLPLYLLYIVGNVLMKLCMGIILGLFVIPCDYFCEDDRECSWVVAAMAFLPITLLFFIGIGIKEIFIDQGLQQFQEELFLPCSVVQQIIQI